MMNVYVNVENTLVLLQQLKDTKNDVVQVTKATCFTFFGMVHPTSPVHNNVGFGFVESASATNTSCYIGLAVLKYPVKYRAVKTEVETLKLL